ncbi:putative multi antimicrobial extrusion protein [Dioscorea sansibarensis]
MATNSSRAAAATADETSPKSWKTIILSELQKQANITLPLIPMNSTWFIKTAITTAFLGRLGELELAAGTLGFTFANVTGFSILTGLCWAMEPICGQAHGAQNHKLLYKTLFRAILLLLLTSIPISFSWVYVDKIFLFIGQQKDIAELAKGYVIYLLPDLVVTSVLCPLKTYLSSQGVTLPTLFSSAIALAFHVPLNILLSRDMGLKGVALATGLTDLIATITIATYVIISEIIKKKAGYEEDSELRGGEGRWLWDLLKVSEWLRLLRLAMQCCFMGCMELWCYEILIMLSGRLAGDDARRSVAVLTVVLNFDYLLYAVMISMATCASTRVSNELGGGHAQRAWFSAYVSLGLGAIAGLIGGMGMVAFRRWWGGLFSHDEGVVKGVRKGLLFMALVEVFSIPLGVCGGVVRGTSRPWLGMFSAGGFYVVGLPLAVVLCFKVGIGVEGLLLGFMGGCVSGFGLLCVVVARLDWVGEAEKAALFASVCTSRREDAQGNGLSENERYYLKPSSGNPHLC